MIEDKIAKLIDNTILKIYKIDFNSKVQTSSIEGVDFQCNDAFILAKNLHLSPLTIAQSLCQELNLSNNFSLVEVKNGFINFVLSDNFIYDEIESIYKSEKLGVNEPKNKELYFLDYGGPNIAKPLHVGHLRSPIIGESVKRIINYAGHNTLSDVHYGDYGLQLGEVIYGLKERNINLNEITLSLLNEIYPEINARIKVDENLAKTCAEITKQLQEGNSEYLQYFKVIREISSKDIKRIYDYLDVKFDFYKGESEAYNYISELTSLLNSKNLLQESNGAKVIDISRQGDKKELPPLIYQKSNGAYLYGTTDMATVLQRVKNYNPDHILYFADIRQDLHYTQFFRAVENADIISSKNLEFHGFGTVNGLDGKPYKTREGKSPSLDSLFNDVKTMLQKNKTMDLEKESDLDKIVNSVIKFADLQNNYEKDYIFDLEKFSKLDGKTGPYILYSYCRLNKVYNKYINTISLKLNKVNKNNIEREIKIKILNFASIFNRAFIERKPSLIAEYLFDFSTKLNLFYETNRFSDDDNKKSSRDLEDEYYELDGF